MKKVLEIINTEAHSREGYSYNEEQIDLPHIIIPNIFVKISGFSFEREWINDFIKTFNDKRTIMMDESTINESTVLSVFYSKDELNLSDTNALSFNSFCNEDKFLKLDKPECEHFHELSPHKKKIVFDAMIKLLHSDNLTNREKRFVIYQTWSLSSNIVRAINEFDFYYAVPTIIDISDNDSMLKNMLLLLLNEIGFDIISINPSAKTGIESKIDIPIIKESEKISVKNFENELIKTYNNLEKAKQKKLKKQKYSFEWGFLVFVLCVIGALFIFTPSFYSNEILRDGFFIGSIVLCAVSLLIVVVIVFCEFSNLTVSEKKDLKNFFLVTLILTFGLILYFVFGYNKVVSFSGDLTVNENQIVKSENDSLITSNSFVFYRGNLYGYIKHKYASKEHLLIRYKDKKIRTDLRIDNESYIKIIPVNLKKKDIVDGFPLTILIENDPSVKVLAEIKIAETEEELNKLLIELNLNQ